MRRSLVLVLGWIAATVVAVGISWAGVRLVAAQVVEPLPVVLDEVTEEPSPGTSPSALGSPSPEAPPSPSPGTSPGGGGSSSPGPGRTASPGDTPGDETPSPSETSGGDDGDHSEEPSEAPSEEEQPPAADGETETRTYSLVGGTVTVEFSSTSVRVIQATPNSGFTRDVEQEGATQIEVEFRSEDHRSRLEAWWAGGPRSDIDEDADSSGSGSGDD